MNQHRDCTDTVSQQQAQFWGYAESRVSAKTPVRCSYDYLSSPNSLEGYSLYSSLKGLLWSAPDCYIEKTCSVLRTQRTRDKPKSCTIPGLQEWKLHRYEWTSWTGLCCADTTICLYTAS